MPDIPPRASVSDGDAPQETESLPVGAVLAWFAESGRDLPWRRSRDPFEILVAELMLQQTQVVRVLDRWPQFLCRFPTVVACASAPVGDVIDEWSGLGYNRRAVFLHAACTRVVADYDAQMPASVVELLDLPGIGPYTARAIMAFAYEADEAVVDTNVGRILARWTGSPLKPAAAQRLADAAVPAGHGWAWNQALLDIGAGVCTSKSPSCDCCPVVATCAWQSVGPDPAVGSASVSTKQSTFAGSDRQGRGRLIRALRIGPVPIDAVATVAGWPGETDRAASIVTGLLSDGLIEFREHELVLAGW